MNGPVRIIVERTGSSTPAIAVHFTNGSHFMTEDTAQVLGRALQQVAFGEKDKLTVFGETGQRPACLYS